MENKKFYYDLEYRKEHRIYSTLYAIPYNVEDLSDFQKLLDKLSKNDDIKDFQLLNLNGEFSFKYLDENYFCKITIEDFNFYYDELFFDGVFSDEENYAIENASKILKIELLFENNPITSYAAQLKISTIVMNLAAIVDTSLDKIIPGKKAYFLADFIFLIRPEDIASYELFYDGDSTRIRSVGLFRCGLFEIEAKIKGDLDEIQFFKYIINELILKEVDSIVNKLFTIGVSYQFELINAPIKKEFVLGDSCDFEFEPIDENYKRRKDKSEYDNSFPICIINHINRGRKFSLNRSRRAINSAIKYLHDKYSQLETDRAKYSLNFFEDAFNGGFKCTVYLEDKQGILLDIKENKYITDIGVLDKDEVLYWEIGEDITPLNIYHLLSREIDEDIDYLIFDDREKLIEEIKRLTEHSNPKKIIEILSMFKPLDEELTSYYINALIENKEFDRAVVELFMDREGNYDNDKYFNILGSVYLTTNDFKQALLCFEKAITINPNEILHYYLKAEVLLNMGRYVESKHNYQYVLDKIEDSEYRELLDSSYVKGVIDNIDGLIAIKRHDIPLKQFEILYNNKAYQKIIDMDVMSINTFEKSVIFIKAMLEVNESDDVLKFLDDNENMLFNTYEIDQIKLDLYSRLGMTKELSMLHEKISKAEKYRDFEAVTRYKNLHVTNEIVDVYEDEYFRKIILLVNPYDIKVKENIRYIYLNDKIEIYKRDLYNTILAYLLDIAEGELLINCDYNFVSDKPFKYEITMPNLMDNEMYLMLSYKIKSLKKILSSHQILNLFIAYRSKFELIPYDKDKIYDLENKEDYQKFSMLLDDLDYLMKNEDIIKLIHKHHVADKIEKTEEGIKYQTLHEDYICALNNLGGKNLKKAIAYMDEIRTIIPNDSYINYLYLYAKLARMDFQGLSEVPIDEDSFTGDTNEEDNKFIELYKLLRLGHHDRAIDALKNINLHRLVNECGECFIESFYYLMKNYKFLKEIKEEKIAEFEFYSLIKHNNLKIIEKKILKDKKISEYLLRSYIDMLIDAKEYALAKKFLYKFLPKNRDFVWLKNKVLTNIFTRAEYDLTDDELFGIYLYMDNLFNNLRLDNIDEIIMYGYILYDMKDLEKLKTIIVLLYGIKSKEYDHLLNQYRKSTGEVVDTTSVRKFREDLTCFEDTEIYKYIEKIRKMIEE